MTEEQNQDHIEAAHKWIEVMHRYIENHPQDISAPITLGLYQIALAALTAPQPVVTGEHLDLIAAHREVADLKEQLAKSEAKFQNMLEAEHRLSDAYIRIREIVGTINLPEGADVWQATEAAAAKLAALESNPLIDHLEKCSAIVSAWPEWKKQGADASKFIRPALAADLAELVPDEWTLAQAEKFVDKYTPPSEEEAALFAANEFRAAILRNIEEAK